MHLIEPNWVYVDSSSVLIVISLCIYSLKLSSWSFVFRCALALNTSHLYNDFTEREKVCLHVCVYVFVCLYTFAFQRMSRDRVESWPTDRPTQLNQGSSPKGVFFHRAFFFACLSEFRTARRALQKCTKRSFLRVTILSEFAHCFSYEAQWPCPYAGRVWP